MNTIQQGENALTQWSQSLASAPHVVLRAAVDEPQKIQRLADGAASLHGLMHYVRENYTISGHDLASLEWDIDLVQGASAFLYRNLGLSAEDSAARIKRLSGAMQGTARYMDHDPLETWLSVRAQASSTMFETVAAS